MAEQERDENGRFAGGAGGGNDRSTVGSKLTLPKHEQLKKDAVRASEQANQTDSSAHHVEAAKAHADAAKEFKAASERAELQGSQLIANGHAQAAKDHAKDAGFHKREAVRAKAREGIGLKSWAKKKTA